MSVKAWPCYEDLMVMMTLVAEPEAVPRSDDKLSPGVVSVTGPDIL